MKMIKAKVSKESLLFMVVFCGLAVFVSTFMSMFGDWIIGICYSELLICFALWVYCKDPYFGNGRPYHWVRQLVLSFFGVLCLVICLYTPIRIFKPHRIPIAKIEQK